MCVLLVIQLLLVGALKGQDNLPVVYNSSEILEKARLAIEDGHLEDALLAYQQIYLRIQRTCKHSWIEARS